MMGTDARKAHFWNGCTQGSSWTLMRATRKTILTDARNGLLGNGCAQGMRQIPDARNLHPGRATSLTHRNLQRTGARELAEGRTERTLLLETSSNHFFVYSVHGFWFLATDNIGFFGFGLLCHDTTAPGNFFLKCFAATQLARQLHQERTHEVYSNKVARNRITAEMHFFLASKRGHFSSVQFNLIYF